MGHWDAVDALDDDERALLERYVLWPDLRAAWLRAQLGRIDHDAVDDFLERYGSLKPAREIRYRYALHLADVGDLDSYLEIYRAFYQGREIPQLDCIALHAEIRAGRESVVIDRARELWMTGYSQVDECNPVFRHLRDTNRLSRDDYVERYRLSVEAREFSRARWLARSVDESLVEEATRWLRAHSHPEKFISEHSGRADTGLALRQLAYAVERLSVRDPGRAQELWVELRDDLPFPDALRHSTSRYVALQAAYDGTDDAYELLTKLPLDARDREVLLWRARTSLSDDRWSDLLNDVAMMSDADRNSEQWRYWRAIALERTGEPDTARQIFTSLATNRSYYGFLAADELGVAYAFSDSRLEADEAVIRQLATRRDLIRARELFRVGLDGRGRSEWDAAVAWLTPREKTQAAILASRWGWHSRAISTAASVGSYDDLELRYPLPWRQAFETYSSSASIPATWALGVARSESLFMRDARSGAGAVGLMQLLPSTGRKVAREMRVPYAGLDTLTDPVTNIRLGTRYLGDMARRYDGNRVLATAAYNAGPHRVDRWLPESGTIDARTWIESFPYRETRSYIRRVMAAETIFHWRLTGHTRRLSDELPDVKAPPADQQVAAR
jgi:soluble lytic murein transglycosylase